MAYASVYLHADTSSYHNPLSVRLLPLVFTPLSFMFPSTLILIQRIVFHSLIYHLSIITFILSYVTDIYITVTFCTKAMLLLISPHSIELFYYVFSYMSPECYYFQSFIYYCCLQYLLLSLQSYYCYISVLMLSFFAICLV